MFLKSHAPWNIQKCSILKYVASCEVPYCGSKPSLTGQSELLKERTAWIDSKTSDTSWYIYIPISNFEWFSPFIAQLSAYTDPTLLPCVASGPSPMPPPAEFLVKGSSLFQPDLSLDIHSSVSILSEELLWIEDHMPLPRSFRRRFLRPKPILLFCATVLLLDAYSITNSLPPFYRVSVSPTIRPTEKIFIASMFRNSEWVYTITW